MNIDLSPDVIKTLKEIQQSELLIPMITSAEDFIIENADDGNYESCSEALSSIQGLRIVRRLIEGLQIKECYE